MADLSGHIQYETCMPHGDTPEDNVQRLIELI